MPKIEAIQSSTLHRLQRLHEALLIHRQSGQAILQAADDPVGQGQVLRRSTEQSARTQGQIQLKKDHAFVGAASSALSDVTMELQKLQDLADQASFTILSDTEQAALQQRYSDLRNALSERVSSSTYNGKTLVDGSLNVNLGEGRRLDVDGIQVSALPTAATLANSTTAAHTSDLLETAQEGIDTQQGRLSQLDSELLSNADLLAQQAGVLGASIGQLQAVDPTRLDLSTQKLDRQFSQIQEIHKDNTQFQAQTVQALIQTPHNTKKKTTALDPKDKTDIQDKKDIQDKTDTQDKKDSPVKTRNLDILFQNVGQVPKTGSVIQKKA